MNSVVKPFIEEHATKFELKTKESNKFEHLINYISMRNHSSRTFDPSDTFLGEGEIGLDGVGIFVNGMLVSDVQAIEGFAIYSSNLPILFGLCLYLLANHVFSDISLLHNPLFTPLFER